MTTYDVVVIGAGPAGIMAAITASETGRRVALIEKNPQIGRKLLATGNGRCNLTNARISTDHYHGANPEFIGSVVKRFDQHATMRFFESLGLILKEEENGRIFPRTNQATSVVEVLEQKLKANQVDILNDSAVDKIEKASNWKVTLTNGHQIAADKLILATGGRAAHQFGSTGDGWSWVRRLGHTITFYHAALVPVETNEDWPSEVQGLRVEAKSWATCGGAKISEEIGDVLFTSYGLSGPCIMAQARNIAPLLKDDEVMLHIDMFPEMTEEDLQSIISRNLRSGLAATVKDSLTGVLPKQIIPVVSGLAEINEDSRAEDINEVQVAGIVRTLKDISLAVSKLRPFKEAQVTAGGIDVDEIDPATMKSKLVENLYFAGEIIDVDGDSGGFNLQWAWSSGYVAGKSIER